MSGFMKKAVVWLGLNEEYPTDDRAIVEPPRPDPSAGAVRAGRPQPAVEPQPYARPPLEHPGEGTVRVIPMDDEGPTSGTVRAVAAPLTTKPKVVIPGSFNDAQTVADHFKASTPVIVNMQNAERDLARRLIDFSSGLCYGLGGQMERVADSVYLLTPTDVEVSDEERQRFTA